MLVDGRMPHANVGMLFEAMPGWCCILFVYGHVGMLLAKMRH